MDGWMYRDGYKECDFSNDIKLLKSSDFEGDSVFSLFMALVYVYK